MLKTACCTSWKYLTVRRGDIDAFTQIFLNNLGTTLIVAGLLTDNYNPSYNSDYQQEYSTLFSQNPSLAETTNDAVNEFVYKRIVVGLALSIAYGSIYYCWMALRNIAFAKEKGEDSSVEGLTALPFGINTPAAFAFVSGILVPQAKIGFNACYEGFTTVDNLNECLYSSVESSWQAGVLSNFACGLIAMALSFLGNFIVRYTPRVSLLSSLATIGFAFLLLSQITLNFADPVSGLLPFAIMLMGFFCGVKYWVVPTSIVVVIVGSALSWATGAQQPDDLTKTFSQVGWQGASLGFDALGDWSPLSKYFGVIFPFAVQAAVSTLMNVVSAEKAGDKYPVREAMLVDGSTSVVGAIFGTPMMTAVYIGHPGFKSMGATTSYTLMNAVIMLIFALCGLFAFINGLFPPSSLAPVIAFIGFIICTEAMDDLPQRHLGVFIAGLVPGICSWATQNGLAAFGEAQFGYIAMGGPSNMFFAMTLTSIFAYCTDKNFLMAIIWSIFSAIMAAFGLLHQDTASVDDFNNPHGSYCVTNTSSGAVSAFKPDGSCAHGYVVCSTAQEEQGCGWTATTQMNFMIGYFILAAWLAIFYVLQRTQKFPDLKQITEPNTQPQNEAQIEYRDAMRSLSQIENRKTDTNNIQSPQLV